MKIAVCVKQVPDAGAPKRIDPQTKRLDRSVEGALNPFDVHAVEDASVRALTEAVDALVRTPRGTPAESLTVLGRDAPDEKLVDALVAHLAAHHPGVEATVLGPTGHGPALVLGLD